MHLPRANPETKFHWTGNEPENLHLVVVVVVEVVEMVVVEAVEVEVGMGPGREHWQETHLNHLPESGQKNTHRTSNFKAPDQLPRDQACWQEPTAPSWFLWPQCLSANSVS